jgi:hypothetical protein
MKKIESIEELKKISSKNEGIDCFIALNGGARSSKRIRFSVVDKLFNIYNEIDDSEQFLPIEELDSQTNIVKAINAKALYMY